MRSTRLRPRAICNPETIGRKQHVTGSQRHSLRDCDSLFARALYIEGDLPLALRALHAIVIGTSRHHVPQPHLQLGGFQMRIPRADGTVFIIEDSDQRGRQVDHCLGGSRYIRSGCRTGRRQLEIPEIRRFTRPCRWMGNVQARCGKHAGTPSELANGLASGRPAGTTHQCVFLFCSADQLPARPVSLLPSSRQTHCQTCNEKPLSETLVSISHV